MSNLGVSSSKPTTQVELMVKLNVPMDINTITSVWHALQLGVLPLVPPVRRKAIIDLIIPKISSFINVCTFPVLGSGRRSSRTLPRDMMISCCLLPEKLPWTACVMAVAPCSVRPYTNILLASYSPPGNKN